MTQIETCYGCCLSALTGLARDPPTANLPMQLYRRIMDWGEKNDRGQSLTMCLYGLSQAPPVF